MTQEASSSRWRRNWGFALFSAASLIALIKLLNQATPGHYRVFTSAAQALLQGQNPYGTDFGTGVGYYFYSPSCALFLFAPFSLLPEKIGLFLYMALSWTVFVFGTREFLRAYFRDQILARSWNWFWLILASQMWGGILASKVEVLMTGILLLSCSWILRGRWNGLSAVLLAMILNWKFQPLPTVGLLLIAWTMVRREWLWPFNLVIAVGAWYGLPFLVMPRSAHLLSQAHQVWSTTLQDFVAKAWLDFENIFAFLNHALGIHLTFRGTQLLSMGAGALLAAFTGAWIWRQKGRLLPEEVFRKALLLSLALGAMFTVAFSPLAQNNALIIYSPLLVAGFVGFSESSGNWRELWRGTLVGIWGLMTLPYSDIFPASVRDHLRYLSLKPVGCVALAAVLIFYFFYSENRSHSNCSPN